MKKTLFLHCSSVQGSPEQQPLNRIHYTFTIGFWAGALLIMVFAMLTVPVNTSAQGLSPCGTPDITPAQNAALLQQLNGNPAVAGTTVWDIPVWVYVIQRNGQSWANNLDMAEMVNDFSQLLHKRDAVL